MAKKDKPGIKRSEGATAKPRWDDHIPLKSDPTKTRGELRAEKSARLKPYKKGTAPPHVPPKGVKKTKTSKQIIKEVFETLIPAGVFSPTLEKEIEKVKRIYGDKVSIQELMIWAQIHKSISEGDTKAFTAVMDRYEGKVVQANVNLDGGTYEDYLKGLEGSFDEIESETSGD